MVKTWTQEKIDIIKSYLKNNVSKKVIAQKLNTTIDALDAAIRRYNLQEFVVQKPSALTVIENTDFSELDDSNFEEEKEKAKLKWVLPKSTAAKPKGRPYKMTLFFPDSHIPHHNVPACKGIIKLMNDEKFDSIAIIGDFLDYGCISHWNRNKHKTLETKRLKSDYIEGNAMLDEFDKALPKNAEKHFLKGNHEVWVDDLLEDMPQLEGMVEPESQLFLAERGYKVYQYNDLVQFGRLFVTHGIYANANPIKKHLDDLKVNILFGHTHQLGMMLSSSPAREIAFSGYNIGCVCDLSPEYMKNRPHSWTHGFAVGYFYPDGYFDVQLIRIVEGKFIFNNKIYDGNV